MATVSKPPSSRVQTPPWFDLSLMLAMIGFLVFMYLTGRPGGLGDQIKDQLDVSLNFLLSFQFLLLIPGIFLLEYLIPARPEQRGFSPTVFQDALYMMLHLPVIAGTLVFLAGPIHNFLDTNASWLVVDSTRSWPQWLAAIVGIAIADFGAWVAHLIKHKVPWMWRFHMIHHSQKRMNLFTANRTHPVDALIESFILLLPFFILFPSITEQSGSVFLIALASSWYVRFQHANIGTNMGPLRYILVTPQSHRVHHSTEPEHWNSNYANLFAWDRLFGTQHSDDTSYPTTGINDRHFPEPKSMSPLELSSSFVGQMLFPLDREAVARASAGSPNDEVTPT